MLHLVRHGRPLLDPDAAADTWPLDPAGSLERLRRSPKFDCVPEAQFWTVPVISQFIHCAVALAGSV